jgi:hypothetical protein
MIRKKNGPNSGMVALLCAELPPLIRFTLLMTGTGARLWIAEAA